MNSTSVSRARSARPRASGTLVLGWLAALIALPALAADNPVPRPQGLERDVQFWVRVYTEINTNAGFLHDDRNLGVVYETMKFASNTSPRDRQSSIDAARDRYIAALRRIAATSAGELSSEDQRIMAMWGSEGTPGRLLEATNSIRFQLGQADRFLEGLVRAGAWESHIAEVFANQGLPHELAALPHVESSFNAAAYSKVGAAGLWQFMRSTGRRYMRIDNAVDDRLDPFRSTEAAAQLLAYNYRVLGTWPLALTAYNHGAAGMRRAKEAVGTDDIERIVRTYKSPSFGFASRNFYVSFLAALEIDSNPDKYFGGFKALPEVKFREVAVPSYVPMSAIQRALKVDTESLRRLNPALRPLIWNGQRHVPKGYRLRLPADGETWTSELLAQRLTPSEQYANQPEDRRYRVRKGESLASIAAKYGTTPDAIADLNGMSARSKLKAGRTLIVPQGQAITVAAAQQAAAAKPAVPKVEQSPATVTTTEGELQAQTIYVVRQGDSLEDISKRAGISQSEIMKMNRLKNRNYIYEGQKLMLAAAPKAPASEPTTVASTATPSTSTPTPPLISSGHLPPVRVTPTKPVVVASATPSGGVPAAEAQRESEEDAQAVAQVNKPATRAEPVSAAQAEALSPALGPAVETPQTADPIDYSINKDDTIRVVAEETLGHYADWLGVTAQQLRTVNNMKFGKPVLIGRKLKLDFSKVSKEQFEQTRREYHRTLQASYFAAHRILGTEVYIVRRGDSLWTVTQRYARLPMWLLQQYNPDTDFADMRAGTELVVPKVEEVAAENG